MIIFLFNNIVFSSSILFQMTDIIALANKFAAVNSWTCLNIVDCQEEDQILECPESFQYNSVSLSGCVQSGLNTITTREVLTVVLGNNSTREFSWMFSFSGPILFPSQFFTKVHWNQASLDSDVYLYDIFDNVIEITEVYSIKMVQKYCKRIVTWNIITKTLSFLDSTSKWIRRSDFSGLTLTASHIDNSILHYYKNGSYK